MEAESQPFSRRVADRFDLTVRYTDSWDQYGVETWRAVDTVLARELRAIVIPHDHPHRTATLDAARRAGLFEDAGVTRVLFVADEPETSVILTEFPLGTSLTSFIDGDIARDSDGDIDSKPLPESIVTAIFGETTSAINHARNRGLRHLQLSARHIYISDSGEVTLDGIATLNALAGVNTDKLSSDLDRDEARGLIVFFAALLHGEDFPADPATHDDYVRRACDLPDLPQRVRDVFQQERDGHGAQSPADLLRMLVPWGSVDPHSIPNFSDSLETYENNLAGNVRDIGDIYDAHDEQGDIRDDGADGTARSANDTGSVGGEYGTDDSSEPADADDADADDTPTLSPSWPSVFETVSADAVFTSFGNLHDDEPAPYALLPDDADSDSDSAPESVTLSSTDLADTDQNEQSTLDYDDTAITSQSAADSSHIGTSNDAKYGEENQEENEEDLNPLEFTSETLVNVGGKSFPVANVVLILFALAVLVALIAGVAKLFAPLDPVQIKPYDEAAAYYSRITQTPVAPAPDAPAAPAVTAAPALMAAQMPLLIPTAHTL